MHKRVLVSGAWLAAVVLIAGPALGQTFKLGSDIFVTPADGATRIDLSQYPVIEEVFGSPPSPSLVQLKGKPIAGLGKTDTVVDREDDLTLAVGQTGTSRAVLRGLSLVSQSPVHFNNEPWDLFVSVSPLAGSVGTVTATRTNQEGGSFNATLEVYPHLIFTRGSDVVIIDCGVSCEPITLTSTRAPWVSSDGGFSPTSAGVPKIPNGTLYDGNGDGIADDEFIGGSNFYPGFRPVAPYLAVILSHDHPPVAEHEQEANTQCKTTTSTVSAESRVTAEATAATALCAVVAEPTEPAEPTGTADAG
jgi:hypothetical protein